MLPMVLSCVAANNLIPTPTETSTSTPTLTFTPTLTATPTATPTATEVPAVCGGPRVMYILLVGSDARSNSYKVGLADSIRILRVDFVDLSVRGLAFPRDLYVEIPSIEQHYGITHGKLNQAFLYGNPGYGYYDDPDLGPGLLADTLNLNFGADIDHYMAANLQTFTKAVDVVGGLDINLPFEVDGRSKGSRDQSKYFPSGQQHLNGYRTMLLARMRPYGDIKRSEVQNLILKALAEKLLDPSFIPQLPTVADAFYTSVQTDLGPLEAGQLACLAAMLDTNQIEFLSFPDDLFKSARVQDPVLGNTSIVAADFEVLKSYVQKFEGGVPFDGE